jgi:hypothetical protein
VSRIDSLAWAAAACLCTVGAVLAAQDVPDAVYGTASAVASGNVPGDDVLDLWDRIVVIWAGGNGLAFVLFIALVLFFTGRLFTGRERERLEKQMVKLEEDWKKRYDENDRRWERQLEEVKSRSQAQEQLLYQMMGMQREATFVARQATTAAVAVAATAGNGNSTP